jgi:predicted DNA-binding antitoxin AbrB/MazE fold protein
MKEIISAIFENGGFSLLDIIWEGHETMTYVNGNSEVYIIDFVEGIPDDLHTKISTFCSNGIFNSQLLTRAQKSNLYVVIVSKLTAELNDKQKNQIYMIEENNLYYKKYFMWYTNEEVLALKEILSGDWTLDSLNKNLIDYGMFTEFKMSSENNKGYSLLSRLYIKLAFLTLNDIQTLDKSLMDYIKNKLKEINNDLFEKVIDFHKRNDKNMDELINMIDLDAKELREIDKLMSEVSVDEK